MEAKIKEVQDYFKNRIISGDYKAVQFTPNYIVIDIDGHRFNMWVANGPKYFRSWDGIGDHFMFLGPFTEAEQVKGWDAISKLAEANAGQIKQDRITALEKELNALKQI